MDPQGSLLFFTLFTCFSYTYTDTDSRTDGCCNFYLRWPGLDPWILVMCWVFPHISDSFFLQIRCHFCFTIAVGRTHFLQGSFSVDPYMLANPFGSHA